MDLMRPIAVPLARIYVPQRLRGTLDPAKAETLAADILEHGLKTPIQVRRDGERYVIVTGLHRLEAVRLLGETTIPALVVQARQH